jgi:hypothetical protein
MLSWPAAHRLWSLHWCVLKRKDRQDHRKGGKVIAFLPGASSFEAVQLRGDALESGPNPTAQKTDLQRQSGLMVVSTIVRGPQRLRSPLNICDGFAPLRFSLRCYKVRSLSFLARKPCDILGKYLNLRGLHGENCACFRPGWVAGEARAVLFALFALNCDALR